MKRPIIRRSVPTTPLVGIAELNPVLQRIYAARGIQSPQQLETVLTQLLPTQQLLNCDLAAKYLADAIVTQQAILILGDYDTDGATSIAVAVSALKAFGAQNVDYLVPNRFEYGYGLTPEIVALAAQKQPQLIVTVDNGIASHAGVAAAQALGMQVIITDHHLPADTLPSALVIVNPQQPGDCFPSKNLAGVGVIFYVMLALRSELRQRDWFKQQNLPEVNMSQFLDRVALGTVADLVPLDHNNRILVHQGVQRIRTGKACCGIQALLAVAGRQPQRLVASDLGYFAAPRLNAAGRLADMSLGVECLLASNLDKARTLASNLNTLNEERRSIEREMQNQAFAELNKILQSEGRPLMQANPSTNSVGSKKFSGQLPAGICLHDDSWHQGVIGLLASRVKEHFHRPAIIFAPGNSATELKGSARSIPGLHIRDLLDVIATRSPGLIDKFGGHAMAAGLTLTRDHYSAFRQAFQHEVAQRLSAEDLQGMLYTDGELNEHDFQLEFASLLRDAGPWGQMFPEPLFDGRFKLVQQIIVGGHHLKLVLCPLNSNKQVDGIAFNINTEEWPNHRATAIEAVYKLDVNEYQGRSSLQLIIEQLKVV